MKTRIFYLILAIFLVAFSACEEEGDTLSIADVNNPDSNQKKKFFSRVDVFNFESNNARGKRIGNDFEITASSGGEKIRLTFDKIEVGVYLGTKKNQNQIYYESNEGVSYNSFVNPSTQAVIQITSYNQEKSTVSGNFSSYVYRANVHSADKRYLSGGEFNDVLIDNPFEGTMEINTLGRFYETYNSSVIAGGGFAESIFANFNNDSISIQIAFPDLIEEKQYDIIRSPIAIAFNTNIFAGNPAETVYYREGGNGRITITRVDRDERIIEGMFEMVLVNRLSQSIEIKDGSFKAQIK